MGLGRGLFYCYGIELNFEEFLTLAYYYLKLNDEESQAIKTYLETPSHERNDDMYDDVCEMDNCLDNYTITLDGIKFKLGCFPHDKSHRDVFKEEYYIAHTVSYPLNIGYVDKLLDIHDNNENNLDNALKQVSDKQARLMLVGDDCTCCT
jgi:hypothetical protein